MDWLTPKLHILRCVTGLRGYHVYQLDWKPNCGQEIVFNQENNNFHNRFAVAGQTKLPGKLSMTTVGHIPREISRFFWYALKTGLVFPELYRVRSLEVLCFCKEIWKYLFPLQSDGA